MKWKQPPMAKIYEALGAVFDGRVEIDANRAKVYSSSGNKYYDVSFDPDKNAIMANDNGSFWKGYLGYPSIAFLMKAGIISYDQHMGEMLGGVKWKDLNQRFKNDFEKTINYIVSDFSEEERKSVGSFVHKVYDEITNLKLNILGKKTIPPEGY